MTAQDPARIISDPKFRIYVRDGWGGGVDGVTNLADWDELPIRTAVASGYSVASIGRTTIDEMAEARIDYQYGMINGQLYESPGANGTTVIAWDPETETYSVPDLVDKFCIIQRYSRSEMVLGRSEDVYVTCFAGVIVKANDGGYAAAETPAGIVTYVIKDFTYLMEDWKMDRHVYYFQSSHIIPDDSGGTNPGAIGHPGYNAHGEGRVLGNRIDDDVLGFGYDAHTAPGSGELWTDYQMIVHALKSAKKPFQQPLVETKGDWDIFENTTTVQPVSRNESVASFLRRMCDRRRGKGSVVLRAVDSRTVDFISVTSQVQIVLFAYPQFYDDLEYTLLDETTVTIAGAATRGTVVDLDFIDDQRCGPNTPETFAYDVDAINRYDRVETIGQRIRVTATLTGDDGSLEQAWNASDASAYAFAGSKVSAQEGKYGHVYRQVRLPRDWNLRVSQDGTSHRIDLRCVDEGQILRPTTLGVIDTSWLEMKIEPYTTLFYGWDYTGATPALYDSGSEGSDPSPIPIMIFARDPGGGDYYRNDGALGGVLARPFGDDGRTYEIQGQEESDSTGRYLETVPVIDLYLTATIRLPHRVGFATNREGFAGDEEEPGPRSTKQIFAQEYGLHVLDGFCIQELDPDDESPTLPGFFKAVRAGCQGATMTGDAFNIGITRDDRAQLAGIHAIASQWYLQERAVLQWVIYDCLLALEDSDEWPDVGHVVGDVHINGRTRQARTVCSKIQWNRKDNVTKFWTAWGEYDWR